MDRVRVSSSWDSTSSIEVGIATPPKSVKCVHSHLVRVRVRVRVRGRVRVRVRGEGWYVHSHRSA